MINEGFMSDPHGDRLTSVVKGGRAVFVIGSGLSSGIYPAWHLLVGELRSECRVETGVSLSEDTEVGLLLEIADRALMNDRVAFERVLQRRFSVPVTRTNPGYELLLGIQAVQSYVTINFDPLLKYAAQGLRNTPECRDMMLVQWPHIASRLLEGRNIFYLHGCIEPGKPPSAEKIILAKSTFDIAYSNDKSLLPQFWDVLLSQYAVLFVGCGLREPAIQLAMKECQTRKNNLRSHHDMHPPPAFILRPAQYVLGQSDRDWEKERLEQEALSSCGLTIVRYDPKDDAHSGLLEVLEAWNPPKQMSVYSTNMEAWAPNE